MPAWVIIALIAPALLTAVNFIDKYVLEHRVKDHRGMPIFGGLTGLIFATTAWLTFGHPTLGLRDTSLVLSSGAIAMAGYALYWQVLSKNHTSYVIAMLQTTPVFTLVLAVTLLGDHLSAQQLLGFVLVLIAAIALSVEKDSASVKLNSSLFLALLANLFFAAAAILIKFTVNLHGLVPVLTYESWGIAIGGTMLFLALPRVRRSFLQTARSASRTTLVVLFANEAIFLFSKVLTFFAILLGSVSIVSLLTTTQVFYGLLFGAVLTLLWPRIFKEQTARRDLSRKAALSSILIIGVALLG